MAEFKRKLYRRGSSMETTVPKPLLFALDNNKRHDVIFKFDIASNRWYIEFEESSAEEKERVKNKRKKK